MEGIFGEHSFVHKHNFECYLLLVQKVKLQRSVHKSTLCKAGVRYMAIGQAWLLKISLSRRLSLASHKDKLVKFGSLCLAIL